MGVLTRLRHYPHHPDTQNVFYIHKLFLGRERGGDYPGDTGGSSQCPGGGGLDRGWGEAKGLSRQQTKKSQRKNSTSKQRLQSLMFGDGSFSKSGNWNRSTVSGGKNQMYKQNFSIKMAGNKNLKQC